MSGSANDKRISHQLDCRNYPVHYPQGRLLDRLAKLAHYHRFRDISIGISPPHKTTGESLFSRRRLPALATV